MDSDFLSKAIAGALGASPFGLLSLWVIRWAFAKIKEKDDRIAEIMALKDARIAELTNALFKLAQSGERTAAVALGVKPELGG